MAIGLVSHAAPGALGRNVTEGYLTQPMVMETLRLAGGRVVAVTTLNLEGLTLRRGEINTGMHGEGYIDRRHPHTYLHEAMLGASGRVGPLHASIFGGKGFVPFGSDDPMVRPFVKFPVNHHLAQVMERVMVAGALRAGPATLEVARFNGDEPEGPGDWPNAGRALDSWAARLTTRLPGSVELSVSHASLTSPEYASGQGLDHAKRAASARVVRGDGLVRYGLLEWARTAELDGGGRTNFAFNSALAEVALSLRGAQVAARVERTERPEEDRLDDPYRSVRPLLDFNILGRTRWDIVTIAVSAPSWQRRWARATPFVEGGWLRPRALAQPAAIDPVVFYAARSLWIYSAGVRLHAGQMRSRFGRYGAAQLPVS